jgi:hypothetical protein
MSLREVCHCGHDKATHYPDEQSVVNGIRVNVLGACLGMRCDCGFYLNENEPKPKSRQSFPAAPPVSDDDDEYVDDATPITLPMIPVWPKINWP